MLKFLTSGESHGKGMTVIIDGFPAGLKISKNEINSELKRRQKGYGRGQRMISIESDKANIISGIRFGETIGSPITLFVENKDWLNWTTTMDPEIKGGKTVEAITSPRPGHADLPGIIKYFRSDIRDVLERASARETVARVALGAICKKFLSELDIRIVSYVEQIGEVSIKKLDTSYDKVWKSAEQSIIRCPDITVEKQMIALIKSAAEKGDTVGGIFTIIALNIPVGLGSYIQWDRRLDGNLAKAMMSIPGIKGVEIGIGFGGAKNPGSKVHDEIFYNKKTGVYRKTNNAGGIEGGISNGEPIIIRAVMKPIPSLQKPLVSFDIKTGKKVLASRVRSDVCAVPAASVIGESMAAVELTSAILDKFGSDTLAEIKSNLQNYLKKVKNVFK